MTKQEKAVKEQAKAIDRKFGRRAFLVAMIASLYPESAERDLRRTLKRYNIAMTKLFNRAEQEMASGRSKKAVLRRLKHEVKQVANKYDITPELGKITQRVEVIEERQFRKSFKQATGQDMVQFKKEQFKKERDDWIIFFIGGLASYFSDVGKKIDEIAEDREIFDGPRLSQKQLERFNRKFRDLAQKAPIVTGIARDMTGTLQAAIEQAIYKACGVDRYKWRTRRDSKVRECHKSFDGKIFKITEPPEIWYGTKHGRVYTGRHCHPGEDYNCRCTRIPVFSKEMVRRYVKKEVA